MAEEKSEEEESEREKKEKRRETRLIRFSWRVGARGRRGLLRGEASGQMELDCTLSVGG